jgi:hypothetical protein
MSIETKDLLELLKKKKVKEAILSIIRENKTLGIGGFTPEQDEANAIVSESSDKENKIKKLEEEIEVLKGLIEKWKKCFSDEKDKNHQLEKTLLTKDEEYNLLKNEKAKLQGEIKEEERKKEVIKRGIRELESKVNRAKEETKKYKEPFKEQLEVYDLYQKLNETTKSSLKGIFKDDSLIGFFACGVQEKNIDSFWEYTKNELIEEKNSDLESLIQIFNFLFEKYLMAYPLYEIQKVQEGDEFKTEHYIRDSNSSVSGNISKVLLQGWVNTKTGKTVKKTVVRI